MDTELERLARLDRVDRERSRQQGEAAKLRTALAEAEAEVASATSSLHEADALVQANKVSERQAQRRLDELRGKRASAIRILETGAGSPEAAQRQLESCDQLIDQAETEMLELLEAQDGVVATANSARARLATAERTLSELRASHPGRIDALVAEAERLGEQCEAELAQLPGDLRKRYQSLRGSGKWPVAHVRDGSCDMCRMSVPAQNVAELKKGRLVECNGCRRWLVLPE